MSNFSEVKSLIRSQIFLNYKHDFNQRSRYMLLMGPSRRQLSTQIREIFMESNL